MILEIASLMQHGSTGGGGGGGGHCKVSQLIIALPNANVSHSVCGRDYKYCVDSRH